MTGNRLFVIGAGSGGVRLARRMAGHNWDVTIAEEGPLGGTCVNRGCIPKKLYVYAAEYGLGAGEAPSYGWKGATRGTFDLSVLSDNVTKEIKRLNGIYSTMLENAGVRVLSGRAQFSATDLISCQGKDHVFDVAVIAGGARPRQLTIPGAEFCIDSDDFFQLDVLPKSAVVLGGGYIALELASILQGLGCKTHVIHRSEQFLRGFDTGLVDHLLVHLRERGMIIEAETDVQSVENVDGKRRIVCKDRTYTTDLVLSAVGRVPHSSFLNLEAARIGTDKGGRIAVDNIYQTSNHHVYAIGDITGGQQLTPVAISEAERLVHHLTRSSTDDDNGLDTWEPHHVPSAVFTIPELATVGMSETIAHSVIGLTTHGGEGVRVYESGFRALRQTMLVSGERTEIKVVCTHDDRLLGCHMMGHGSAEIIQMLTPLVRRGAYKNELDKCIGIHPSVGEELFSLRSFRMSKPS